MKGKFANFKPGDLVELSKYTFYSTWILGIVVDIVETPEIRYVKILTLLETGNVLIRVIYDVDNIQKIRLSSAKPLRKK